MTEHVHVRIAAVHGGQEVRAVAEDFLILDHSELSPAQVVVVTSPIESEDGSVRIEYQGVELVAHAFPKDARVSPAAIVENKALSGALLAIQAKQRERDQRTPGDRRLTLREEDHLKKAMGRTG